MEQISVITKHKFLLLFFSMTWTKASLMWLNILGAVQYIVPCQWSVSKGSGNWDNPPPPLPEPLHPWHTLTPSICCTSRITSTESDSHPPLSKPPPPPLSTPLNTQHTASQPSPPSYTPVPPPGPNRSHALLRPLPSFVRVFIESSSCLEMCSIYLYIIANNVLQRKVCIGVWCILI